MPERINSNMTSRPVYIYFLTAIVLLCDMTIFPLFAQNAPATQPAASQPADGTSVELSPQAIQAQIKLAESIKDEATRKDILEAYNLALQQIQTAAKWSNQAEEYEKSRKAGPTLLAEIRQQLDKLPAETAPQVPDDATLPQLEQKLSDAKVEFKNASQKAAELDSQVRYLTNRRIEMPKILAELKQRQEEGKKQYRDLQAASLAPEIMLARKTALRAQRKARQQEQLALESEQLSYDARLAVLTAQKELAVRIAVRNEKTVKAWEDIVARRRLAEAKVAAEEAKWELRNTHPALKAIAQENLDLASQRTALAEKMTRTAGNIERINKTLNQLRKKAANVSRKIKAAGLTNAISLLLRKERSNLYDIHALRADIKLRQNEIAEVQYQLILRNEELVNLEDLDGQVAAIMASLRSPVTPAQRKDIELEVRYLLQTKQGYLNALVGDYNKYFENLVDLDTAEQQLIAESKSFADYIDEQILWFKSTSSLFVSSTPANIWGAICWLMNPRDWINVGRTLLADASANPGLLILAAVLFIILFTLKHRYRSQIRHINDQAMPSHADTFGQTMKIFLLSMLLAVVWPALIFFFAWRISVTPTTHDFVRAVASGLFAAAINLLTLEILHKFALPNGIAEKQFKWNAANLKIIRRNLYWFMILISPMCFIIAAVEWQNNENWKDSLGRLSFILCLLALAVFMRNIIDPLRAGIKRTKTSAGTTPLNKRPSPIWYLLVVIPIVLAVIAVLGYYYTAIQLTWRMIGTIWLLLALMILQELLFRWLFLAHRRLARLKTAKHGPVTAPVLTANGTPHIEKSCPEPTDAEMNIYTINEQTRKFLNSFLLLTLFVGLWLIWSNILPALNISRQITLWTVTDVAGKVVNVTLFDLAIAVVVFIMTFIAGKNIPGLLEITILPRLPLDQGVRFAITTITRYAIIAAGVIIAFEWIGVYWNKLSWLVGALLVGLGFGLQEIFANLISGLIILAERPMRVGDIVTVGNVSGTVTRIKIRATTIVDADRKELIVPNKEFITGRVINWTLSDRILRIAIPVSIAYGSDTDLAQKILLRTAKENPKVLATPAPTAVFTGFGATSLNFELAVFASVDNSDMLRHELNTAINKAFTDSGIRIP